MRIRIRSQHFKSIRILTQIPSFDDHIRKIYGNIKISVADPWHFGVDPDRSMHLTNVSGCGYGSGCGSFYFHHWPSRCQQTTNKKKVFLHITFWRYFYIIFQRLKVKKKSQNSRNKGFSYYLCLMIEGSGSGSEAGSILLTDGSGSGSRRSKKWIRWIRIRIRNTDKNIFFSSKIAIYCTYP